MSKRMFECHSTCGTRGKAGHMCGSSCLCGQKRHPGKINTITNKGGEKSNTSYSGENINAKKISDGKRSASGGNLIGSCSDKSDLTVLLEDYEGKNSGKCMEFKEKHTLNPGTGGCIDSIEPVYSCVTRVTDQQPGISINNTGPPRNQDSDQHATQSEDDKKNEKIISDQQKDISNVCSAGACSNLSELSATKHEGITSIDLLEELGQKCGRGNVTHTARLVTGSDNSVPPVNTAQVASFLKTLFHKSICQDDTSVNGSFSQPTGALNTKTDVFLQDSVPDRPVSHVAKDRYCDNLYTNSDLSDIKNCDSHSIVDRQDNRINSDKIHLTVTSDSGLIGVEILPITSTAGANLCGSGTFVSSVLTNRPVVSAVPATTGVNIGRRGVVSGRLKESQVRESTNNKCVDSKSGVTTEAVHLPSELDNRCSNSNCQGYTSCTDSDICNVGPAESNRLNCCVYSPEKCHTVSILNSGTLACGSKCSDKCTCSQSELQKGSDIDYTTRTTCVHSAVLRVHSEKTHSDSTFCDNSLQLNNSHCDPDYAESVKTSDSFIKTPNKTAGIGDGFPVKYIQTSTQSGTEFSTSNIDNVIPSSQDNVIIHKNDPNSCRDICKQDVEIVSYKFDDTVQSIRAESTGCLSTDNSDNIITVNTTDNLSEKPCQRVEKWKHSFSDTAKKLDVSDYTSSTSTTTTISYVNVSAGNRDIPTLEVSEESEYEFYDSMPLLTPVEHMATSSHKENKLSENERQLERSDSNNSSDSIPLLIPVLSPAADIPRSRSNSHDSLPPLLSPVDDSSSICGTSAEKGEFSVNRDNCTKINPPVKDSPIKQLTQKELDGGGELDPNPLLEHSHLDGENKTDNKLERNVSNSLRHVHLNEEKVRPKEEVMMESEVGWTSPDIDSKINSFTNQKSCHSEIDQSRNTSYVDIQDGVQSLNKDEVLSECIPTAKLGQCQGDKCNNKLTTRHSPETCLQETSSKKDFRSEGLLESLLANLPQDGPCDNGGSESINADPQNSTQKTSTRSLVSALLNSYNNNNTLSSSLVKRAVERFVDGQPCVDSIISDVNGGHKNTRPDTEQIEDQNNMDCNISSQAPERASVGDSVNSAPVVKNKLKVIPAEGGCVKKAICQESRMDTSVESNLAALKKSKKSSVKSKDICKGAIPIKCMENQSCDVQIDNCSVAKIPSDKSDNHSSVKGSSVNDINDKIHYKQLSSILQDRTYQVKSVDYLDTPGKTHMLSKHSHSGPIRSIYLSSGKPTVPCVTSSNRKSPGENDFHVQTNLKESANVSDRLCSVMKSKPIQQLSPSQKSQEKDSSSATETRRSARVQSKLAKCVANKQNSGFTDNNSNFVQTESLKKSEIPHRPGCHICEQYSKQQQRHIPLEMDLNKVLVQKRQSLTILLPRLTQHQISNNRTRRRRKTYSESFCDLDSSSSCYYKRRHSISTDKIIAKCKNNSYSVKKCDVLSLSCQGLNNVVTDKKAHCRIKLEKLITQEPQLVTNMTLGNSESADAVTIATHPKAVPRELVKGTSVEVGQRKNSSEKQPINDRKTGGRAEAACMSGCVSHQAAHNTAAQADNNITTRAGAARNKDINLAKGKPRNIFDNFQLLPVKSHQHTPHSTEQHTLLAKQSSSTCLELSSELNNTTHSLPAGAAISTVKTSSLIDYQPFKKDKKSKAAEGDPTQKTSIDGNAGSCSPDIVRDIQVESCDELCTNEPGPDKGQVVGNIDTINVIRTESGSRKDCHALTNNEVWSGEDVLTNSSHCCSLERSTRENTEQNYICHCVNAKHKDIHLGHLNTSQEYGELCARVTEQDNPIHDDITHEPSKSSIEIKPLETSVTPTPSELISEHSLDYTSTTIKWDLKVCDIQEVEVLPVELGKNTESINEKSEKISENNNNNITREQVEQKFNTEKLKTQPHKNILPVVNLCRIETEKTSVEEKKQKLSDKDKYFESDSVVLDDKTEIKSELDSTTGTFCGVASQEQIPGIYEYNEEVVKFVNAVVTQVCELEASLTPDDCTPDLAKSCTESEHNCTSSIHTGAQSSLGSQHTHNETSEWKQGDPIHRLCQILNPCKKKDSGHDFEEASQKIRELYEQAKSLEASIESEKSKINKCKKRKNPKRPASQSSNGSVLLSDYIRTEGNYSVTSNVIEQEQLEPVKKKRGRPKGSKNRPKEERDLLRKLPKKRQKSEANYVVEPGEVDFIKPQLKVVIKKLSGGSGDSLDYSPDKSFHSDLDLDSNSLSAVPSAPIPQNKGEWLNVGGTSTPLLHSPAGLEPEELSFQFLSGSVDESNLELFPDLLPVSDMDVSHSITPRETSVNSSKESECRKETAELLPSCSTLVDTSLRNQPIPSFQQTFGEPGTNPISSSNGEKLAVSSPKDLQSPCSTIASVSTESGIESDIPSEHIYTPEGENMSFAPSKLTKAEKYENLYISNSVPYGQIPGGFGTRVNPVLNDKPHHRAKVSSLMEMLASKGEKNEQNTPMLKSILESDPFENAKQESNSDMPKTAMAPSPDNMEFPPVIETVTPTRGRGRGRGRGSRGKRGGGKRGRPRRSTTIAASNNDRTNYVETADVQQGTYHRSASLPYPQHEHVQRHHPYPGYNRQASQPTPTPSYMEGNPYNQGWNPYDQPYPESDNGMYNNYMNNVPNYEGYPGHFNENTYADPNNAYVNPNNNFNNWEGGYPRTAHPASWRGHHMNPASQRGYSQRTRQPNYASYRHNLYPTPPPTRLGFPDGAYRGDLWMGGNPNMPIGPGTPNGNPGIPEHPTGPELTNEGPALHSLSEQDMLPPDISQVRKLIFS